MGDVLGHIGFGDPTKIKAGRHGGRKAWTKGFKQRLVEHYGSRCGICSTTYEPRYLQIDHRIPFEVAGDPAGEMNVMDFMLLCGSCNRAKSWSCEHCKNWTADHLLEVCMSCYWATPEDFAHIALELIRRLDIVWKGKEVPEYDRLLELSKHAQKDFPDFVKEALRDYTDSGT